jgi:hypothetical protein
MPASCSSARSRYPMQPSRFATLEFRHRVCPPSFGAQRGDRLRVHYWRRRFGARDSDRLTGATFPGQQRQRSVLGV